ncbi:transmembrane protein 223 [Hippocampus comes]|uniref:transmembrane protein 223 n=1 Tax=Hippocampus comes TaxID=109280 RepID=UPI00094E6CBA|nr:PREDICTED: transmembrane protein 223 [Hippocampus comes]
MLLHFDLIYQIHLLSHNMSLLRICGALCPLRPIAFQQKDALLRSKHPVSGLSIRLAHVCFARLTRHVFAHRGLCTSIKPTRDVTLFQHDRTGFFRLLAVFCGGQFIFWSYLAHFAYTGLRDTGTPREQEKRKAPTSTALAGMWSFDMNLGSSTWRYGFTLGCVTIGGGILGLGILFCRRSVSQVVLHQGGTMVSVTTQSPLGMGHGRRIKVPLSQVACHAHRQESPSFIPLKIKGHKFYFLLDKDGTINNAKLFDVTAGAYRPL